jgi:hypothetical protein
MQSTTRPAGQTSADRTSLGNGRRIPEATAGMGENVANLAHDFVALGELQAKLLMLDLKEGSQQAINYGMLALGAAALLLGTIPVLLLAIGTLFAQWTELPLAVGWLIISAVAIVLGAVCVWVGLSHIREATKVLQRSRDELRENVDWIKRVIRQPRR